MAANYTVTVDPNDSTKVIITYANDGVVDPDLSYVESQTGTGETGTVTEDTPDATQGTGLDQIWSTPVQDGTAGIQGNRGPGNFGTAVTLYKRPSVLESNPAGTDVAKGNNNYKNRSVFYI